MLQKSEIKNQTTVPNLMTVRQFAENFPAFSTGAIRNYIFYEELNGLQANKVIKRVGKKILIDVERFFLWVESQNQGGAKC